MSGWTRRSLLRNALIGAGLWTVPGCGVSSGRGSGAGVNALSSIAQPRITWRNWAGDHACTPLRRAAPRNEEEVLELLRTATGIVRPVGAGHSFSPLVPSEDTLIACDLMSGVIDADAEALQAEVWAGTRLHALGPALEEVGQALVTQPDIDDQVLAGAIATSTHGTGRELGSLSSYVVGLTLATPSGELIECDRERNADVFHSARCSLGALGVVTRLRLQNRAPYRLMESTRLMPMDELLRDAEALRDTNRHMEFMALPYSGLGLLMTTNETEDRRVEIAEDPRAVYGLREGWAAVGGDPATYRHVLSEQLGGEPERRLGPSYRVLAHDRFARFREMEYTVPAEDGPACLAEILETIEREAIPVVFPIEYRYVARDDVWLSMFNDRDGCTISIHQYADEDQRPVFEALEPIFWRYAGRPHWGKMHSLDADRLASLYPRWGDFARVRRRLDPSGKMLNEHVSRVLVGSQASARPDAGVSSRERGTG